MTIRNAPRLMPIATPSATATRSPQGSIAPAESSRALSATAIRAGSAIVVLDLDSGGVQRRVVFTGDHGRKDLPILRDPEPLPECDALITESTYGDRIHELRPDMMEELGRIITEEQHDGGRVLIPAFSVGRTQSVVLFLGQLMRDGKMPRLPIYVDSPMSRRATKIMGKHPDLFDEETCQLMQEGHDPLLFDGVTYVDSVEQSKSLNQVREGVIISASGMVESGRILHHLKNNVWRPACHVVIVGYQAIGTLGRRLVDGADEIRLWGETYPVRASVHTIGGLSAHADQAATEAADARR